MLNYLALLGWGPPDDTEFFQLNDLIHAFSLDRVNKTNAVFDQQKLNHINALHFKNMKVDEYCLQGISYFTNQDMPYSEYGKEKLLALLKAYKDRIACFSDLRNIADYFFQNTISFDKKAVKKYFNDAQTPNYLQSLVHTLKQLESFNDVSQLEQEVRSLAEELGVNAAALIHPIRVAITGKGASPGVFDVMSLLGKEKVLSRIQYCIDNFDTIVKQ